MTGRLEKAKMGGQTQKSGGVGRRKYRDILQVFPTRCTQLLTIWWETVVITGKFLRKWAEGKICPL